MKEVALDRLTAIDVGRGGIGSHEKNEREKGWGGPSGEVERVVPEGLTWVILGGKRLRFPARNHQYWSTFWGFKNGLGSRRDGENLHITTSVIFLKPFRRIQRVYF